MSNWLAKLWETSRASDDAREGRGERRKLNRRAGQALRLRKMGKASLAATEEVGARRGGEWLAEGGGLGYSGGVGFNN